MGPERIDSRRFRSPPTDAELLSLTRHGVITHAELRAAGKCRRATNHPGARRLDRALRAEAPFTRSGLEDATLALFASFSVPRPETNQWIWDGEKLVEVDFAWRERRRQDAARTAALQTHGWTVLRFSQTVLTATSGLRKRR